MNTYEIYTENYTQIVQAKSICNAILKVQGSDGNAHIIRAENIEFNHERENFLIKRIELYKNLLKEIESIYEDKKNIIDLSIYESSILSKIQEVLK